MSLSDIRQDPIFALLRLENERNENIKRETLKKLQSLLMSLPRNYDISFLKPYINLNPQLENQIKIQISHLIGLEKHSHIKDFAEVLKIIKEHTNPIFAKNIQYTNYLIACEKYQQKTGKHPSHDSAQSVHARDKVIVNPIEGHEDRVHDISLDAIESEKSPAFIDKRDYKDGGVRIYHGIKLSDLEMIDKEITKELNEKYPESIEFKKTEKGHTITIHRAEILNEYEKLHENKLKQKYEIFSHSSHKKEKDIPEKYHLNLEDDKKSNNKLRR